MQHTILQHVQEIMLKRARWRLYAGFEVVMQILEVHVLVDM